MTTSKRDRTPPWPALLLLAAVIIAAVAVLTALATANSDVVGKPPSFAHPTPTAPGPIADVTRILEEPLPESLVGRRVHLTESTVVQDVLSDVAFLVGREDRHVLVVLGEPGTSGLSDGASITFVGEVEALGSLEDARDRWRLPEASVERLSGHEVYVAAERVQRSGE
jgi:hypothetical protein